MKSQETTQTRIVITPVMQNIVSRSMRYLNAGYPVHLTGPAGVGKTTLALHIAKQLGRPVTTIYGHHDMNTFDLLGGEIGFSEKVIVDNYIHSVQKRERRFQTLQLDGQLLSAVEHGHTLVYDEFTRSRAETNNILLSVLEEGALPLYGMKDGRTSVSVHPSFSVIFTSNPTEYSGVFESPDALMDRMITIDLGYLDADSEVSIVAEAADIFPGHARRVVDYVSKIRSAYSHDTIYLPSIRSSIKIAKIAAMNDIEIDHLDSEFQMLCCDVLGFELSKFMKGTNAQEIHNAIISVLRGDG